MDRVCPIARRFLFEEEDAVILIPGQLLSLTATLYVSGSHSKFFYYRPY